MITTNDKDLGDKIRMLRYYGQTKRYIHSIIGFNSRLDEFQATILRIKLKYLDSWVESRRNNAKYYNEHLMDIEELVFPYENDNVRHAYFTYALRSKKRDDLEKYLNSRGISTALYYPTPVHLLKPYQFLKKEQWNLPESEKYSQETISIPVFPEISNSEREYIVNVIHGFFDG